VTIGVGRLGERGVFAAEAIAAGQLILQIPLNKARHSPPPWQMTCGSWLGGLPFVTRAEQLTEDLTSTGCAQCINTGPMSITASEAAVKLLREAHKKRASRLPYVQSLPPLGSCRTVDVW
jgi:hypothetical protein